MTKGMFLCAAVIGGSIAFIWATVTDLQAWDRCMKHKSYHDCYYEVSQGKWYK